MGLEYPCHRCGSQIRISEPRYGVKYRCPRCRAKVKFKARAQDQIEVPFVLEEVRPHPALGS
jgi:DNA-directed RNA polymerase subunit RPC12/RpoP